jgi:hypothetical protein
MRHDPLLTTTECRVVDPEGGQLDTRPDEVLVARLAERDWGVLTVEELRACGLTDREIALRARRGRLHRRHRGVFAVGHANLTLPGRFMAAVKACGPGALLSHFASAALRRLVV